MLTWKDFKRELLNRFRYSQKINQYVSRLNFSSHDETYYNPLVGKSTRSYNDKYWPQQAVVEAKDLLTPNRRR